MKFIINGIEYKDYELSNEQLIELLEDNNALSNEQKEYINNVIIQRFKDNMCKRNGESEEELFARQFGKFVNGRMSSPKEVAKNMARDHRYLQNEMFKVCLEYIKILGENYSKGNYDARNEYACEKSYYSNF